MNNTCERLETGLLDFFPEPYPDELFSNVIFRYHKLSGNSTANSTTEELFSKKMGRLRNSLLPSYLDSMVEKLLCEEYTSEYFIYNHSIFRLMRLLLSCEKLKKCVDEMRFGNAVSSYYQTGLVGNSKWLKTRPYVCNKCLEEDIAKYGEGYIRALHQVPGYMFCHVHDTPLRKVGSLEGSFKYIDINEIDSESDEIEIPIAIQEEVKKISMIMWNLYKLRLDELSFEKLIDKYNIVLDKKGYKKGRYVKSEELAKDFHSYYPYDLLKYYDSHDQKRSKSWLSNLTKDNQSIGSIHRHALFIGFLFDDVQGLLNTERENEVEISVFGEGPWPCLNDIADHYGEKLINDHSISKTKHSDFSMGIFECEKCGFAYYRKSNQDELRKHKVRSFGHLWDSRLVELLSVDGVDFYEAAKQLKVERKVLLTNARRLGLESYCINDVDTDYNMHFLRKVKNEDERFIHRRNKYRAEILEYMSNNPNSKRNDLFNALKLRMSWLKKHDEAWYERNIPAKSYSSVIEKKKKNRIQIEWKEKDEKYSKILLEFKSSEDYINVLHRRRITKSFLNRQVINYPMSKYLGKVPKSKQIYEELLENYDEYYKKKIDQYLNTVDVDSVTKRDILRAIGVTQSSANHEVVNSLITKRLESTSKSCIEQNVLIRSV